jgi:molybdopterin converting factor small subunit
MVKTGVKVIIPQFLTNYTGNVKEIVARGGTVGECLGDLVRQFPGIRRQLLDESGQLLGQIDVYINRESTFPEELAKTVKDGDEMNIINVLSGG